MMIKGDSKERKSRVGKRKATSGLKSGEPV